MSFWGETVGAFRAGRRLRTYRPNTLGFWSVREWLRQYPREQRRALMKLLNSVRYFDETEINAALVAGNNEIVARLEADGIEQDNIIYVQHDDAGSSSGVMLNLLRDAAQLQLVDAVLLDGANKNEISKWTNHLQVGAIVYVDDFAGTGNQFLLNRKSVAPFIAGSFSEFYLSVVVCEEAKERIEAASVVSVAGNIHRAMDRPLHDSSQILTRHEREILRAAEEQNFGSEAFGYGRLATNVVFFRNAPDTTPRLLRGHEGQAPLRGVLPRTTDLALVQ
jgi:hypothetical protein